MLRPALALTATAALGAAELAKPNVLLIVADDLGYRDTGFQGGTEIPTPNLDRLAASGVRCSDGYVSSAVCSPSRAGILTGRQGCRFGYEFNNNPPSDEYGLPLSERTLADRLKEAGYATGIIGKWHLGVKPGLEPTARGFDFWHGHIGGGHKYQGFKLNGDVEAYDGPLLEGTDGKRVGFKGHLTAHFGSKAVQFVNQRREQPWFLYLAFNAPHSPLEPAAEDLAVVQGIANEDRRNYAGLVVGLDRAVGRVLDAVRNSGQEQRTLVVFLSDNGGPANHLVDKKTKKRSEAPPFVDNAPLRDFKHSLWDGGIRVPFVWSWPGRIKPGTTSAPIWSLDIAATAVAAAGVAPIADADGVDVLPFLSGASTQPPRHELFIRYAIRGQPGRMLRQGPLKLLDNEGSIKLFDLVADPGEQHDLAASRPDDLRRLEARWAEIAPQLKPALWGGGAKTPTAATPAPGDGG